MTAILILLLCLLLGGAALFFLPRLAPSLSPRAPRVPLEAYRTAFEQSRDGLYLLDADHRYVDVNASWLALVACDRSQLIGRPFGTQAGEEEDPDQFRKTTHVVVKRTDVNRTLEMSCVTVDVEGRALILGRAKDVTQREHDRARLERLQASVNASTDGLFVCSSRGQVVYRNEAARPWLKAGLSQVRWHLHQGHAQARFEVCCGEGAAQRVGIMQLSPTAYGVVGCVRDVSHERHSDEQQRIAEGRLHEVQRLRSLGILAGRLAHDYNNLLTGIHGFAVLASETDDPERIQRYLSKVLRGSEQATDLTRQLRQFSSHKAGSFERVELSELMSEVERSLRGILGETVTLSVRVDDSAPVVGDQVQLRQLLLNLALRVREALNGHGRGRASVRLSRYELGDDEAMQRGLPHGGPFARIEFEDDVAPVVGEGASVFEPFAGVSEGLGLPVAYGIVMRHGGAIQVASSVGGGARFTVLLPIDQSPFPAVEQAPETNGLRVLSTGRVLIVDDEEIVLELAASVLSAVGFEVEVVSDGEQALTLLQSRPERYDLLLCDVVLPGCSGLDVAEQAQRLAPRTRLLLMTGYTGVAPAAGLTVIEKPFSPNDLLRRVREILELTPVA